MERSYKITMKGQPVTLLGKELKVGDKAPDFTLLDTNMAPVKLSDSKGKPRLLSIVTALETDVCNIQTQTFNNKLASLANKAVLYTISTDQPRTQDRYVSENKIDSIKVLSDYQTNSFGNDYGLLIKENGRLARAVIVVDKDDRITHMQVVPEVTTEPNYNAALEALRKAIG